MAKKVKKSAVKVKKKIWVPLIAPKLFGGRELGESTVDEPRKVLGKVVKVNLMTLLRDPKKQGINVRFKVVKMHSDHAETVFSKYELMPSSIKRIVRRNRCRIDHSFKCKTSDGHILTVKPVVLTMNKTNKSVTQALRKKIVSFLYYSIQKKTLDSFIQDLINHKVQLTLKQSLSKLYPIAIAELRVVSVDSYPEGTTKVKAQNTEEPAEDTETTSEEEPAKSKPAKKEAKAEVPVEEPEDTDSETSEGPKKSEGEK